MFESLFDKAEEVHGKPTTVIEDVSWILNNTNFVLLRAAWDEFLHILRTDSKYDEDEESDDLEGIATDCWYALKKLQEKHGDLTQFDIFELHLLKALKDGYNVYDEILHVLIDHHNDTGEAKYLFQSHPEIHLYIPKEFDNPKQVMEVLAETARIFRWELEQFSTKHSDKIDTAVKIIIGEYAKSLKK